jgi:hypothetical protein
MIRSFPDDEYKQPGMVCMCVVNMIGSESLETAKNTPDCSNGDDRSSDQICVYVHLLSLNAHTEHMYRLYLLRLSKKCQINSL